MVKRLGSPDRINARMVRDGVGTPEASSHSMGSLMPAHYQVHPTRNSLHQSTLAIRVRLIDHHNVSIASASTVNVLMDLAPVGIAAEILQVTAILKHVMD